MITVRSEKHKEALVVYSISLAILHGCSQNYALKTTPTSTSNTEHPSNQTNTQPKSTPKPTQENNQAPPQESQSQRSRQVTLDPELASSPIKIILLIDNSPNMKSERSYITNVLPNMFSQLRTVNADISIYTSTANDQTVDFSGSSIQPTASRLSHYEFIRDGHTLSSPSPPTGMSDFSHISTWELNPPINALAPIKIRTKMPDSEFLNLQGTITAFIDSIPINDKGGSNATLCSLAYILTEQQKKSVVASGDQALFVFISDADDSQKPCIYSQTAIYRKNNIVEKTTAFMKDILGTPTHYLGPGLNLRLRHLFGKTGFFVAGIFPKSANCMSGTADLLNDDLNTAQAPLTNSNATYLRFISDLWPNSVSKSLCQEEVVLSTASFDSWAPYIALDPNLYLTAELEKNEAIIEVVLEKKGGNLVPLAIGQDVKINGNKLTIPKSSLDKEDRIILRIITI